MHNVNWNYRVESDSLVGGLFHSTPHHIAFHSIAATICIVVVDQAAWGVEEDVVDQLCPESN